MKKKKLVTHNTFILTEPPLFSTNNCKIIHANHNDHSRSVAGTAVVTSLASGVTLQLLHLSPTQIPSVAGFSNI